MPITPLPDPPETSDPDNFDARADAFLGALPDFADEANALEENVNDLEESAASAAATATAAANAALSASDFFGTTSASLSVATGSTGSMTLDQTGLAFAVNDAVVLVRRSDTTKRMYGSVTAANSGAGTLTVNRTSVQPASGGGGPYTDWMVFHQALESLPAATTVDLFEGATVHGAISPAALRGAQAFATLTDAATVAWSVLSQGFNAEVTLGGNRTIGAVTGLQDGDFVALHLIQDGTGSRVASWNSQWDFGAPGTPTLQTGAGKRDQVFGQYRSSTSKIHASFRRGV